MAGWRQAVALAMTGEEIEALTGRQQRQFRLYCVENGLCPRAAEILVKAAALCSEAAD